MGSTFQAVYVLMWFSYNKDLIKRLLIQTVLGSEKYNDQK